MFSKDVCSKSFVNEVVIISLICIAMFQSSGNNPYTVLTAQEPNVY